MTRQQIAPETPRLAFVMEQTLGHVTHYTNLRTALDADPHVDTAWYPLPFVPAGPLWRLPVLGSNWSARASLLARLALARDRAAERYDTIFFHTQVTTLLSAGLMRRMPSVISLDATPANYDTVGAAYGHRRSPRWMEYAKRTLNQRTLHRAAALVTWCEWARESLISDYGVDESLISVIAPGVDLARWPKPAPKGGTSPIKILFVGGDFERKGGEVLLSAFDALETPCELHLVTSAPVEPRPGVHVYHDVKPNSQVLRDLYASSDIFVLPTLADCFPLVIQEAMAAGLPIVSTAVGAIGEAVRDGETGRLVPPGDVISLRAALGSLASSPDSRIDMGQRGRSIAEREYDSAANARKIADIMCRVARGTHP